MLAADGRCKTLDASADGYVRAEGAAVLQLRVVHSLAGEPRQPPHVLVLGAAVNQDGRSSSLTAPSGPAQQALLKAALSVAHVPPSKVQVAWCEPWYGSMSETMQPPWHARCVIGVLSAAHMPPSKVQVSRREPCEPCEHFRYGSLSLVLGACQENDAVATWVEMRLLCASCPVCCAHAPQRGAACLM